MSLQLKTHRDSQHGLLAPLSPMLRVSFALVLTVAFAACPSCEPLELSCDGGVCVVLDQNDSTGGGAGGGSSAGAAGGIGGGLAGGSAAGGISGGLAGGSTAGGISGGLAGGSTAGGISGGLAGGSTAGGSSGGVAGGSGGGVAGGSGGGVAGGSGGGIAGGSSGGAAGGSAGGCTPADGGIFSFSHTGLCLGTANGRVEPGNRLIHTTCDAGLRIIEEPDGLGVRFRLPAGLCSIDGSPPYTLACCVDLPNADPLAQLVVWVCHGDAHQRWQTTCVGSGWRSVRTAAPASTCLEVRSALQNEPVMTGSCMAGALNQLVSVIP